MLNIKEVITKERRERSTSSSGADKGCPSGVRIPAERDGP